MANKGLKAFQAEMKPKRAGTCAGKGKDDKNCKEEITVQRLSSKVAGKQQKYSRIGPREFVDFSGRELTIANIKETCTSHGVGMVCDILAGEQGPSCSTVKQIPDTKLIHVPFVDETEVEIEGRSGDTQVTHHEQTMNRKQGSAASGPEVTQSLPSPNKKAKIENAKSKFIPKSLSVSSILNLGQVVKSSTTLVNLNLLFTWITWYGQLSISQLNFRFQKICLDRVDLERPTGQKVTPENFQIQSGL